MYKIIDSETIEVNGEQIILKDGLEFEYSIVSREEEIENLCMWITENSRSNDKKLMLEDLKQLINLKDEYILSSNDTNEYIAESEKELNYNGDNIFEVILKDMVELNLDNYFII